MSAAAGVVLVAANRTSRIPTQAKTVGRRLDVELRVEELAAVTLWFLAFAVGGPLLVVGVFVPPMTVAHGLVWLGMRTPGRSGRLLRAWQQNDPGTPMIFLTCVQIVGLLVALWTGLLGRLLLLLWGADG